MIDNEGVISAKLTLKASLVNEIKDFPEMLDELKVGHSSSVSSYRSSGSYCSVKDSRNPSASPPLSRSA